MQHTLEKPMENTCAYAKNKSYLFDYFEWINRFGALKMNQVALNRSLLWLTYRSLFQPLHKMNVIEYYSPNCLLEDDLYKLNETLGTNSSHVAI